jgi:hypothetical protein
MNNDLIIGCSTNYTWDTIKYWVNSVNKCGFTGDKVLIMMNADKHTMDKVVEAGFSVIGFNQDDDGNLVYESPLKVHVERFLHIFNHLNKIDYRYVITTDVKDVVFQRNPVEWLESNLDPYNKNQLVFSSESMIYKDEPWGKQNLLETFGEYMYEYFKNNEIFNVGVLAGRGYAMKDLAINIFLSSISRPIPIVDQSTFNVLVSMEPYKSTSIYNSSEDGWACQLGTTVDPSKIEEFKPKLLEPSPTFRDGKVYTSNGSKEYYIVHQYDRVPAWRAEIEKIYG